jgi:hypothetical protein
VNSTNELIDVSDDSGDESSDDSSDSDDSSESDSESSDQDHDHDQEHDQEHEVIDNNTRKILFTGSNDSHIVEHLDGPDVKVIELTHPLYAKNTNEEYNNKQGGDGDDNDNNDDEADEDDADDDEDSDSESISSDLDGHNEPSGGHESHEIHEIKGNVGTNEINSQIDLETDNISEVISIDNSLDNLSVKTVFKSKDSEPHSDYNSMNVPSLRQLLRNKISSEGSHMSEASITKLTKKDLIKHLS